MVEAIFLRREASVRPVSFAAIGECMIELSAAGDAHWRSGFAGDTFNTAWYARLVLPRDERVAYITALGDDPFSADMRSFIGGAGIETDRIRTVRGRRPGLYAISLNGAERSFTYWRGESAARTLADDPAWLDAALSGVGLLYFSGITLAILSHDGRARLMAALMARQAAGATVAFDSNYRPALWPDAATARAAFEAACRLADVVLPTFGDEAMLFGDRAPEESLARIASYGTPEVVVKNGGAECLIHLGGETVAVPAIPPGAVVDTTGAGDSFGGAYLAARIMGKAPAEAARLGHVVAAQVIGVKGALARIDRDAAFAAASREGGEP